MLTRFSMLSKLDTFFIIYDIMITIIIIKVYYSSSSVVLVLVACNVHFCIND